MHLMSHSRHFLAVAVALCSIGAGATFAADAALDGRVYRVPPPSMGGTNCPDVPDDKLMQAISATLAGGGIVVLGENHDNFLHHMSRACIVERVVGKTSNSKIAVVFEQFNAEQQGTLDAFAAGAEKSLTDFKKTVGWDASGWSQYKYDPLLQAIIDAKSPLYAGDVTRAMIMKTSKEGSAALSEMETKRLGLDKPLGEKLDQASLKEIEDSHCGMMPKSAFGGMAFGQRYRDAHLADVALKAAEKHGGAIVLAGNTHARSDRGIGWYIKTRAPTKRVLSVAYGEIDDKQDQASSYVPLDPDGKPAADFVALTLTIDRPDPCIEMREMMKKRKAG
jgi:uncharacterized iron-regulated protein